jgi:hypothetical protein
MKRNFIQAKKCKFEKDWRKKKGSLTRKTDV